MKYAKITESGLEFSATQEEGYLEYVETAKPTETAMQKYTESYTLGMDMPDATRRIVQTWIPYIVEPVGRVAKLQGNNLVFPPQNLTLDDGTLLCNFDRLPTSKKLGCGFYLVIEAERPNDGKQYRETGTLVEDADFGNKIQVVLEEVAPIPEPAFDISKLKLGRAFRSIGQEEAFCAYLASDPALAKDWERAASLRSDDPLVLSACALFKQTLGMTDEQLSTMLKQCRSE